MRKLYEKNLLTFALLWIIAYCVLMSLGDNLSREIGITSAVSLPIAITLSLILFFFLKKTGLTETYGLCKPSVTAPRMLYYLPLLLLLTVNLWYGVALNLSPLETALYILTMLCVGFLEEVIFRGLLFRALKENSLRFAVILSSVTFGFGHIINLLNGSGAELLPNLLQLVYATAAGFLFVMIYYRSGSLIPCILTHGVFNALSALAGNTDPTPGSQIVSSLFLIVVSGAYGVYLALGLKKETFPQHKGT